MTPEQEQEILDAVARNIKLQAQAAFEEMMARINAGETPREAIDAVTAQFSGQYYAELSAAFSAVLDSAIGIAEIKQWPVGEVALSKHLYRHTNQVNAVTRQLIQNQAKGFVQMRELAMQIYEGYRFKDDPLKVKAKLPKYLREALRDPAIDGGFARIVAQIRVNQLKTPALKAAYSQMLDALEQEAGAARLKNLLRTAWYERNRYFANRIAQTELHRAYSNQVAQEIMADEEAVWVKYQMSPTHPRVDICDRHAGLDAWGKGKGVYPKALAPKPPAHPHCRCTVRPAYEIDGEPGEPIKDAEKRLLNKLPERDQRLIAGSRARLEAFKNGKSLESIYNQGTNPLYKWEKLGGIAQAETTKSPEIESASKPKRGELAEKYLNGKIEIASGKELLQEAGIDEKDVARMTGTPDGVTVKIKRRGNDIWIDGKGGPTDGIIRAIHIDSDGNKFMENYFFGIDKNKVPEKGLGTVCFATEVDTLKKLGFKHIECEAAGSIKDSYYNGYYTWPRLGYDANLLKQHREILPPELSGATTVLDLMETEQGREWWLNNGSYMNMKFDLTEGSRSLKTLNAYMKQKGLSI